MWQARILYPVSCLVGRRKMHLLKHNWGLHQVWHPEAWLVAWNTVLAHVLDGTLSALQLFSCVRHWRNQPFLLIEAGDTDPRRDQSTWNMYVLQFELTHWVGSIPFRKELYYSFHYLILYFWRVWVSLKLTRSKRIRFFSLYFCLLLVSWELHFS